MKTYKKISIVSVKNIGLQTLKDSLTPKEKQVLLHMLNAGLTQGQVRNKVYHIDKTGEDSASVKIGTIEKSFLLGRNEVVTQKVSIKFS